MKKFLFNLRIAATMVACIAATSLLWNCSSGDDEESRIDELKKLEVQQAKEVREAVVPAKTIESNIESYFNMLFGVRERQNGSARNLKDSADIFVFVVEQARREAGDPLPKNNTTMTNLYDKSKTYIATIEELNQLQK